MPAYKLASHVYGCSTGDYTVLLDLERNRYLGVSAADSELLEQLILGWPRGSEAMLTARRNGKEPSHGTTGLLDELIQCGMVCPHSSADDGVIKSINIDRPQTALLDGYENYRASVKLSNAARFVSAAFVAAVSLKYSPLHKIVARLIARRSRVGPSADTIDVDDARSCVATFSHLQSMLFTARDACLLHSLALSDFLARHSLFPHVVIGVATTPFAAHCWIQHGAVIFNDDPGHVRGFTPILVV
jgi:hypothetical protein